MGNGNQQELAQRVRQIEWRKDGPGGVNVRGVLHRAATPLRYGIVLTHGAGGDSASPLLVALCDAFAARGAAALRCDLPYRQRKRTGPPSPSGAGRDREGLSRAVESLEELGLERVFLGGSSYGGRQASMLAAEQPEGLNGLLLLSYPLHPPGKPGALRTGHFRRLQTPALFVHGSRDAFGSLDEMRRAIESIPAVVRLTEVEGAAHGLVSKRTAPDAAQTLAGRIAAEFLAFAEPRTL